MSPVSLPHVASGKVRDIYELDDKHLLFVTSDRMSAFDVVMAEPIPDKGRVLTAVTAFWVEQLAGVAPSHLVGLDVPPGVAAGYDGRDLVGRVMVVRRAEMLPVECIVRGYLSGSAWAEYQRSQTMHGEKLPAGLRQSERLFVAAECLLRGNALGDVDGVSKDLLRAVGRLRQDIAIEPDATLSGTRHHAHQAFVAALFTNPAQVVVEEIALIGREKVAQVAADAVLRLVAERLRGGGVDRQDGAREVVRTDQAEAVFDELAIPLFAVAEGVGELPPARTFVAHGNDRR